jgi:hypothetical protein
MQGYHVGELAKLEAEHKNHCSKGWVFKCPHVSCAEPFPRSEASCQAGVCVSTQVPLGHNEENPSAEIPQPDRMPSAEDEVSLEEQLVGRWNIAAIKASRVIALGWTIETDGFNFSIDLGCSRITAFVDVGPPFRIDKKEVSKKVCKGGPSDDEKLLLGGLDKVNLVELSKNANGVGFFDENRTFLFGASRISSRKNAPRKEP